jgi:hypothetical protein
MDATEQGFVNRIRDLSIEAQTHLNAAVDAHDGANDKAVAAAHRALGGCLRSIERTFVSLGKAGAAADQAATQTIQTSSGTGKSDGSANGRAAAPVRVTPGLLTGDPAEFLKRARIGGRR